MEKGIDFPKMDGSGLRMGVVRARWNRELMTRLFEECWRGFMDAKVSEGNIVSYEVPGSFELPRAAKNMIDKEKVDAVVCLGVLVKGETMHFAYISDAVSKGIMDLNMRTNVPVIYGVLNCLNEEQAWARVGHGYEWGLSAVEMGLLCGSTTVVNYSS